MAAKLEDYLLEVLYWVLRDSFQISEDVRVNFTLLLLAFIIEKNNIEVHINLW